MRVRYIFLRKYRINSYIRKKWLALLPLLLVVEAFLVYLYIHDVIMVVSLHLNIKLEWIRELENKCASQIEVLPLSHDSKLIQLERKAKERKLPLCPELPDGLIGKLDNINETTSVDLSDLSNNYTFVQNGASRPNDCYPRTKVAIIVPHRDREQHLSLFLRAIHPVMQRQKNDYRVIVVHQAGNDTFNKAMLLNIGYTETLRIDSEVDCFIFHDVDLLPEDDRNIYQCSDVPRHLSAGIDKWGYQLPYESLFGGVIAMRKEHFDKVNGYSNEYWGWGAEDDDMYVRILHSCLGQERANLEYAKYRMMYHPSDSNNRLNPYRYTLLFGAAERQRIDGLSSLQYSINSIKKTPLYINLTVDIGKPRFHEEMKSFGTGVDILITITMLFTMVLITGCVCFRSRLPHIFLYSICSHR